MGVHRILKTSVVIFYLGSRMTEKEGQSKAMVGAASEEKKDRGRGRDLEMKCVSQQNRRDRRGSVLRPFVGVTKNQKVDR